MQFDGGASIPGTGAAITQYDWDFDGDSVIDVSSANSEVSHTYTTPGTFQATLTVLDDSGAQDSAVVAINVTNEAVRTFGNNGNPWPVPGRIEAENFNQGGEGIAYSDSNSANLGAANQGGDYRTEEGVDIQFTDDVGGGYNVGWTVVDEWLEYTVNVQEEGTYRLKARVASPGNFASLHLEG